MTGEPTARVELVLRRMQPVEQADGQIPVHGSLRRQARPIARSTGG